MRVSGESFPSDSVELTMLRSDIEDIFRENADKAFFSHMDNNLRDLYTATEIFLGGILDYDSQSDPGTYYEPATIGILTWRNNDTDTTIIAVNGEQYEITSVGISYVDGLEDIVDDETIQDLRYWLRPEVVKWDRQTSIDVIFKKFAQEYDSAS